jgi:hypothetical protein
MSHLITTRAFAFQVKLTCHGPQAQALAMKTTHIVVANSFESGAAEH